VIRSPLSMLHLELGAALVVVFAALWHRVTTGMLKRATTRRPERRRWSSPSA
jgi:hypothetical protein